MQLAVHHTVVLVHKILKSGQPQHLYNLFNLNYNVKTRLADQQLLKPSQGEAPEHDLIAGSFRWRAIKHWNSLPLQIRKETLTTKFKRESKLWIKQYIPLE